MGCCISRPTGPNSPYPGVTGASGSSRAINTPSGPATATSTTSGRPLIPAAHSAGHHQQTREDTEGGSTNNRSATRASRVRSHGHGHGQPLSQHINRPLRRHAWTSRGNRVWTRAALDRERADFFDTRVTGRPEVWQTLRGALEVLWAADRRVAEELQKRQQEGAAGVGSDTDGPTPVLDEEHDPSVALTTAQSILSAADITLPTGDLAQGAYDALGNYYALPEAVVADPTNMAGAGGGSGTTRTMCTEKVHVVGDAKDGAGGESMTGEETAEELDEEGEAAPRRREEKGKAVVDVRDQLVLRARLSDGSRDVAVAFGKGDSVRSIARRVAEEAELPANKKIRLAYMGKILKEGSSLASQGWKQGHVLNALVFNR